MSDHARLTVAREQLPPDYADPWHGQPDAAATVWEGDPVPLKADRLLRPFPVDALPGWVGEYVAAIAEATQTPVDLAASVALACLSTAAGGRVLVSPSRSWVEPVNVYTVVALPPGSRKSSVFRSMTAPLVAAEETLRLAVEPQRIEALTSARIAQARAEKLAHQAETATNAVEAEAEAVAAAEEAARIAVPEIPRLMTDDVTPESCTSLLARQGGRLAVLSAEGDAFATLTGTRYAATANLGVFLKGHGGDRLQVDRKGRDPECIDRPALTLGITAQSAVLAGLAQQPGFRDRGVLGRILYSLPANTIGRRKIDPDPVPETVERTYADELKALVLTLAEDEPRTLTVTDDARDVLTDLRAWIEPHLDPDAGQLAAVADWANKWAGHVARIAALLHVADNLRTGYATPITGDTMRAAEQIGRYYLDHALAAFDLMGNADPTREDAQHVLSWILRQHHTDFTQRQAHIAVRSRVQKVADLEPALDLLADHGYIAPRPADPNRGRGRPTVIYDVNPAAHRLRTPARRP